MTACRHCAGQLPEADASTLMVVSSQGLFTFEAGHPMRRANCLACRRVLDGATVAVIGAAALAGEACPSGCVSADVFLVHADCFPTDGEAVIGLVALGLQCTLRHQWAE